LRKEKDLSRILVINQSGPHATMLPHGIAKCCRMALQKRVSAQGYATHTCCTIKVLGTK
jgi:hypothetical protein